MMLRGHRGIALLLLHGFTGSAAEMMPLAHWLHQEVYSLDVPLLRGHGTCVEDLETVAASDWTHQVAQAITKLEARRERDVVRGLSLGAILALQAGLQTPALEGLLFYSQPIPVRDGRRFLAPPAESLYSHVAKGVGGFRGSFRPQEFLGVRPLPIGLKP